MYFKRFFSVVCVYSLFVMCAQVKATTSIEGMDYSSGNGESSDDESITWNVEIMDSIHDTDEELADLANAPLQDQNRMNNLPREGARAPDPIVSQFRRMPPPGLIRPQAQQATSQNDSGSR